MNTKLLAALYIVANAAANLILIAVPLPYRAGASVAIAATFVALDITTRDALHDAWHGDRRRLGAAIVALCARVAEREVTTRADLDTLRNGVAWLGAELDRARRWGALWKRAAKDGARDWRDLVAAYEDMRAENAAVRRAARQLVVALACAPRVQVVG